MNLRNHAFLPRYAFLFVVSVLLLGAGSGGAESRDDPFPFSEIGARATGDYRGEAIAIRRSSDGATFHSAFQRLAGTVTSSGLAVESTEGGGGGLRLSARALGRGTAAGRVELAATGAVEGGERTVTWTRPGLIEEYSVSVDGLRQDFIVAKAPAGSGALSVELGLEGATAEATAGGIRLTLDGSGRELVYNRLHVIDAAGRELEATLEALATNRLAVRVEDGGAVYPLRIDPTFSDADWVSMNPGLPGASDEVHAVAVDNNGNLFIGGGFTVVGSVAANHIAKWNGTEWSALGSGLDGTVYAMQVSGSDLYVGGGFATAGGTPAKWIAKWNGSEWSALGLGMEEEPRVKDGLERRRGSVKALAVIGGDLYAGGGFDTAGRTPANNIARWNGTEWSALGLGTGGEGWRDEVHALAVIGTDLYAGGIFDTAGGAPAKHIAKWNGTEWSALGSGMADIPATPQVEVNALAVIGGDLYAGGSFNTAGGTPAKNIAKWNGSKWSAFGDWMNRKVNAMAVSGSDLYVGAWGITMDETPAKHIAKWNGSEWSILGRGIGGNFTSNVKALVVTGGDLYVGGWFATAGESPANHIAKWNGSEWLAFGMSIGINHRVTEMAVSGSDLYVGGEFTIAGGTPAEHIAKWNGAEWSALGTGVGAELGIARVQALAVSGSDLYVGGYFTTAGGIPAENIAKWNGSEWSALGKGVGGPVLALAVSGTDIYAGGNFTTAGGTPVMNIAKWNGAEWSALGSGIDRPVTMLAAIGSDLYAAGGFDTAGGIPAKYIAKWNRSEWSVMGTGLTSGVNALAVIGSDLWVATAGGAPANGIAKWNGSEWSALQSGLALQGWSGSVRAFAVSGNDLYFVGWFDTAGGTSANRIAKWNGSEWSVMGTGIRSPVSALAVLGSDLYVGGNFTTAGTTVSPYLVRATNLSPDPEKTGPPEWTSKDGRVIRAEFVELSGEAVVIRREDGQVFTVPFSTLAPKSIEQAKQLAREVK